MPYPKVPEIRAFFDEPTNTVSYLVWDSETKCGAVIDPVLDYDPDAGEVDIRSVETILTAARDAGITMPITFPGRRTSRRRPAP